MQTMGNADLPVLIGKRAEPPKRIVMMAFENLEQAQATFASSSFVEDANIGEKHAKFRIYAVEGVSDSRADHRGRSTSLAPSRFLRQQAPQKPFWLRFGKKLASF